MAKNTLDILSHHNQFEFNIASGTLVNADPSVHNPAKSKIQTKIKKQIDS